MRPSSKGQSHDRSARPLRHCSRRETDRQPRPPTEIHSETLAYFEPVSHLTSLSRDQRRLPPRVTAKIASDFPRDALLSAITATLLTMSPHIRSAKSSHDVLTLPPLNMCHNISSLRNRSLPANIWHQRPPLTNETKKQISTTSLFS